MEEFKRTFEIDDEALRQLIKTKGEIVDEGRQLSKEIEDKVKEYEALMEKNEEMIKKVGEVKTQIIARIKEVAMDRLWEFEVPVTTELVEGKAMFTCANSLLEFKSAFSKHDKWAEARVPVKSLKKIEEEEVNKK